MTEQEVIEQLTTYRQKQARIEVLATYSVGAGITVSRLNEDDQLQELHRRLRGLPSYMYLSKKEQELETVAHAYLGRYPAGTRSQLSSVPTNGADPDDDQLLRELRAKIQKVIESRAGQVDDFDAVLDRLAELQDLRADVERVDTVMRALEKYKPEYAKLLRLRYIEKLEIGVLTETMQISRRTFERMRPKAIIEFARLSA